MNSSVWVVWAAQGSNEEKKVSIPEQLKIFFFHNFLQNSLQKSFQFILYNFYKNKNKEF
jgi:hypothetical protein